MTAALGRLRLAPRDFWSMTPRELDAALRGLYHLDAPAQPLTRHALDALLSTFPDTHATFEPPSAARTANSESDT